MEYTKLQIQYIIWPGDIIIGLTSRTGFFLITRNLLRTTGCIISRFADSLAWLPAELYLYLDTTGFCSGAVKVLIVDFRVWSVLNMLFRRYLFTWSFLVGSSSSVFLFGRTGCFVEFCALLFANIEVVFGASLVFLKTNFEIDADEGLAITGVLELGGWSVKGVLTSLCLEYTDGVLEYEKWFLRLVWIECFEIEGADCWTLFTFLCNVGLTYLCFVLVGWMDFGWTLKWDVLVVVEFVLIKTACWVFVDKVAFDCCPDSLKVEIT